MKQNAITWLDFRPDDLLQARDFIRSLQEEGVIDELGFLMLQGRFSDLFHPATTTIMRSARYFYFIAGIYRRLELEGAGASQVSRLSMKKQDELRDALARNVTTGVIGRDSKIELHQFPSQIYWSGLRKLGMFTASLSERVYQEQFNDIQRQRRGYKDDDKAEQASDNIIGYWDPELPHAGFLDSTGHVKPGVSFKLTKAEAEDLYKRFTTIFPNSLLTHMLWHHLEGIRLPWDCPKLSPELTVWLGHARNLSLFVRGATLQYYVLLIEELDKVGSKKTIESIEPKFECWWQEANESLKKWDVSEFVTVPTVASALRPGTRGDRWFIEGWLDRCINATSANSLLRDEKARELIREREWRIKPAKSRLKYEKHLKDWKAGQIEDRPYQFDYRHRIGSQFVSEILNKLEDNQ